MRDPSSGFFLVFLGIGLLVVVGGAWYGMYRVKQIRAWAAQVGWTYVGSDRSLARRWRGQPFGIGSSRRVSELVVGPFHGYRAMSFRYQYTTGSGKNRSTSTFHVVAMALPTYLPTLELTPDGIGAKLAKVFGGQDLRFESVDFNKEWRVEAGDAKFASDVLHPRTMERLLQADARGMAIRIEGTDVLCWTPGSPRLDTVATRIGVMKALCDGIPRFVWQDHGYDPTKA